jgi:sugar porter (SP) family MFS transporter
LDKRLTMAAFAGSLGGLVFGYDLGALSSATQSLRGQFDLSPAAFGFTISISLWATVCGSFVAGRVADRAGRRNLIAGCAILYALAAIGIALPVPPAWVLVLTMRFLCGMAIGGFTVGCPLYLSELAPIVQRGRVVSMFQVQVGAGVVVAFCAGALFTHLKPLIDVWKWSLGVGAIPALVLLFLLRFMPERELTLTTGNGQEKAKTVPNSSVPVRSSGRERLFRRRNTRPILLATSIAIFNQLSGVNILLLYMLDILSSAGIGLFLGHTYTVLISCLSLATTLLGMAFVDKLGRKPLLILGAAGMALCLLALGIVIPHHFAPLLYLSILVAYNAFFAFSQGTVVWVYLSELFPPGIRGAGQGYGSSVLWIANAILVLVFPIMQRASSVETFYFFAMTMVLQIVVVWLWYPETRATALGSLAPLERAEGNRLH